MDKLRKPNVTNILDELSTSTYALRPTNKRTKSSVWHIMTNAIDYYPYLYSVSHLDTGSKGGNSRQELRKLERGGLSLPCASIKPLKTGHSKCE